MTILKTNKLAGPGGTNAIDGSVYFQGYVDGVNSDYLKTADLDDYDMGTGDFTFECWLNAVSHVGTNSPNFMGIFSSGAFTAGGFLIQVNNTGPLRLVIPLAAGGNFEQSAGPSLFGTWNHIAVVKTSNVIKGFVNGIEVISASHSVGIDFAHGGYATVGENCYVTYPGDYPLRGYVSNLRLIKGTALYTANFTPPTEKLTAVDGTVLLCCQDSDDPTQEATGKTITGYGKLDRIGIGTAANASSSDWMNTGDGGAMTITGRSYMTTGGSVPAGTSKRAMLPLDTNHNYSWYVNATTVSDNVGFRGYYGGTAQNLPSSTGYIESTGEYSGVVGAGATAVEFIVWQNDSAVLEGINVVKLDPGKAPKIIPPVGTDDSGTVLEGGVTFDSLNYMTLPKGTTTQSNRGRGIFIAGEASDWSNVIQYIQIQTLGNAVDFGDLIYPRRHFAGTSSATRGVIGGGVGPSWPSNKTTEYSTLATTGNATSFGELLDEKYGMGCMASSTRGIFSGGYTPSPVSGNVNIMEYITFASTGNTLDFGDQTDGSSFLVRYTSSGISNGTRGTIAGGYTGGGYVDTIVYVPNIASLSNTSDFGNLSGQRAQMCGCSDKTRGVFMGGYVNPTNLNTIEYITLASTGDATDFGDLTNSGASGSAVSNSIRGVTQIGNGNIINYVNIQTTGNAKDFGDLNTVGGSLGGNVSYSDSHGGLSQ